MKNPIPDFLRDLVQVPGLLKELYVDVAQPGVKQVGQALETAIGLGNTVLLPIALLNAKANSVLRKNMELYRREVEAIDPGKIVEVAPEIAVPILERFTYVTDEHIGQLYANLLAKASSADTAALAHPSFVHLIDSISPDEARLVPFLATGERHAFLEARLITKKDHSWDTVRDLLTGWEKDVKLMYPDNIPAYFSNLDGLGVVKIRREVKLADDGVYKRLEKAYEYLDDKAKYDQEGVRFSFERGLLQVTQFGGMFVRACMTKANGEG